MDGFDRGRTKGTFSISSPFLPRGLIPLWRLAFPGLFREQREVETEL